MAQPRQREPWELKAEDLVRHVRGLLEYHREAIEKALRSSLGKGEAQARLDQMAALTEALELELWRMAAPDHSVGNAIVQALKHRATTILATGVLTTAATLATTEAYQALRDTEAKADQVIECVVEIEAGQSWTLVEDEDEEARRQSRAAERRARSVREYGKSPGPRGA
jgi:hypothetical protein